MHNPTASNTNGNRQHAPPSVPGHHHHPHAVRRTPYAARRTHTASNFVTRLRCTTCEPSECDCHGSCWGHAAHSCAWLGVWLAGWRAGGGFPSTYIAGRPSYAPSVARLVSSTRNCELHVAARQHGDAPGKSNVAPAQGRCACGYGFVGCG